MGWITIDLRWIRGDFKAIVPLYHHCTTKEDVSKTTEAVSNHVIVKGASEVEGTFFTRVELPKYPVHLRINSSIGEKLEHDYTSRQVD